MRNLTAKLVTRFLGSECLEGGLPLALLHAAVKGFHLQPLCRRQVLQQGGMQIHTGTRQHEGYYLLLLVFLQDR